MSKIFLIKWIIIFIKKNAKTNDYKIFRISY